jgi:hypothetical protein
MNFHILNGGCAKLHQQVVPLRIRYTVYKRLRVLFPHTNEYPFYKHIHNYVISIIKLVSKIISDI